jgi:ArsR family transcriptional regulator
MSVTQLGQSRVSTHLGKLRNAGLLCDRRAGSSVFYRANEPSMPTNARVVWGFLRDHMNDPLLEEDLERCRGVVRARGSGTWTEAVAGEMERHYSPGRTWEATLRGIVGLLSLGDVVDLGAGDGTIAELVAPYARKVVCLDKSPRMVEAGRERLRDRSNVSFVEGDMTRLPFADGSFDQALLFNSLTFAERPSRAVSEAGRVLRPSGRLAVITLRAHKHELARSEYNHVHLGFDPRALRGWLTNAGLAVESCQVTSRERREPHFEVLTAHAFKKANGRHHGNGARG